MKITVNMIQVKNELTQIRNAAFEGVHAENDNKRRDVLNKVIEQLRTLQSRIENVELEVE